MTEEWARALSEGFLGAIVGGAIAALIALRTTRAAIGADAAARDRDRRLEAALRFRQFVSLYGGANRRAASRRDTGLTGEEAVGLLADAYIALKSAQFARHGDEDFKAWLTWLHDRLNDQVRDGLLSPEQREWLGEVANLLEGRLLEDKGLTYLERPPKPTGSVATA